MKLLLETVTYIAIKERVTCIIAMETFMCIMHCRKYHLHNCNRDSHQYNYNKKLSSTYLLQKLLPAYVMQKLLIYQSILLSTNIPVTESTTYLKTCKNATGVFTYVIAIESVSCIIPTENVTCRIDYRNFHLQKWCQSEILLVAIKKLRKRVSTNFKANSFSTPCVS